MNFTQFVTAALGVTFIVLKLLDKIDWSWWWVTSPFWLPAAVVVGCALLIGIVETMMEN